MARTLLQIINAVQGELGVPTSSTIIGSTDLATQQLLAFAQAEIEELMQIHTWTALQNQYNLTVPVPLSTTGDVTQDSAVIQNIPSTAALTANNFTVIADDIPTSARIVSVDSGTQVTMDMTATGTAVGTTLLFAQDTFPEPTGFSWFENRTMWDRTNHWPLMGPDSPQADQQQLSGIVATGPRRHFRQVGPGVPGLSGNNWRIWPPPAEITDPLQLVFEYISNAPILLAGTGSSYSEFWTNDTDKSVLDDRAIVMGIKWRYWDQKGFDFTSLRNDAIDYVQRLIARDGGAPTLSLVRRPSSLLISSANVPDGFWSGPTGPNDT